MAKRTVTSRKRRVSKDPNALTLSLEDINFYGEEPDFREDTITDENRNSKLGHALNWYSKVFDQKMTKNYVSQWLKVNKREDDLKLFSKVPDNRITQTAGAMCRLAVHRGWPLSEKEIAFINSRVMEPVHRWHEEKQSGLADDDEVSEKKPDRKSIQEVMLERTMEAGGEIDALFDNFVHVDNTVSIRWLKRLGFEFEPEVNGFMRFSKCQ